MECCKPKRIRFEVDGRGTVYRTQKFSPEVKKILLDLRDDFQTMFGRKTKNDLVLFSQFLTGERDTLQHIRNAGIAAGTPDELIYGYMRTGLMPTAANHKSMPDRDLDDWRSAIDEFFESQELGEDPFYVFTYLEPGEYEVFKQAIDLIKNIIVVGFNSVRGKRRFSDRASYYQFRVFCSALNSMRTVNEMFRTRYDEDCLAILRGIYEQYLRIKLLRLDPSATERLDAAVHRLVGVWPSKRKRNGAIDRKYVVDPQTGREFKIEFSNSETIRITDMPSDLIVYEDLYPLLSENVHHDIAEWSLRGMITQEACLDRGQNQPRAISIILFVSALLLFEMSRQSWLKSLSRRDLRYTVKLLCKHLILFVQCKNVKENGMLPPSILDVSREIMAACRTG